MGTKRKTRSIELSPEEVRLARLGDLKRIDRRVEPQPEMSSEGLRWGHWMYGDMIRLCPYGRAGDRVRLTNQIEAAISEVDVDYCLINDCGCWGWIIKF